MTDELGVMLKERLSSEVTVDLRDKQSFEDWLTLQITPMPFLAGFDNSRRAANAARVIAEIATVLDERVNRASAQETPRWLRQLLAIWDAEKAAVLTFNYDTLVERAVNSSVLIAGARSNNFNALLGDHVVFPSPPAANGQSRGDANTHYSSESFQLIKLHGSLAWYWAAGDSTGSTLVRVREKHVFGSAAPLRHDDDFSGATTLDRYLIPPVTSKDGYYGSYLANALWRGARETLSSASALTIIGYSLPLEDHVASQLIAETRPGLIVQVVDQMPGSAISLEGILGSLTSLGMSAEVAASGDSCVQDFVESKISAAIVALPSSPAFDDLESDSADVVVAISGGSNASDGSSLFVLAWNEDDKMFRPWKVDGSYLWGSSSPYRERVLNSLPVGMQKLDDFVSVARLKALIVDGQPFEFAHPFTNEKLAAIGAERIKIERWELLQLNWAPATV